MKIGVNDGHTLRSAGTGAVGIIKEGEHTRLVGEEVRRLLKERGNTVYNCTVVYASTTNESLALVVQQECNNKGFSKQNVDGIAGQATLVGCPTLKKGASVNITKLLQENLVSLGYSTNGVDVIFGSGTYSAVREFQ